MHLLLNCHPHTVIALLVMAVVDIAEVAQKGGGGTGCELVGYASCFTLTFFAI